MVAFRVSDVDPLRLFQFYSELKALHVLGQVSFLKKKWLFPYMEIRLMLNIQQYVGKIFYREYCVMVMFWRVVCFNCIL